jgi:hypothetical protein
MKKRANFYFNNFQKKKIHEFIQLKIKAKNNYKNYDLTK